MQHSDSGYCIQYSGWVGVQQFPALVASLDELLGYITPGSLDQGAAPHQSIALKIQAGLGMIQCEVAQEVISINQHVAAVGALDFSGKLSQSEQGSHNASSISRHFTIEAITFD